MQKKEVREILSNSFVSRVLLLSFCGASAVFSLLCLRYIFLLSGSDEPIHVLGAINTLGLAAENTLLLGVVLAMLFDVFHKIKSDRKNAGGD